MRPWNPVADMIIEIGKTKRPMTEKIEIQIKGQIRLGPAIDTDVYNSVSF